jgi:hypothetical protein
MGCRFCAWIITAAHIALTSVVPWRSVDSLGSQMEKMTHRIARVQASGMAIATILAMLIAPLCVSNCAGVSGCGAGVGIARSGAEDCHHTVSGSPDSETSYSVFGKACNRQEAPAALLSAPEKSSSLRESLTFVWSFHSVKQNIHPGFDHSAHHARWDDFGDPPQAGLLEITATILRI